ncbi:hypothetical protein LZ30DRAFT_717199 [Colletotrichum cereale]|nr:hypothetical protein LZ30DRAFT_717199 [Colletotrichum cereale]
MTQRRRRPVAVISSLLATLQTSRGSCAVAAITTGRQNVPCNIVTALRAATRRRSNRWGSWLRGLRR